MRSAVWDISRARADRVSQGQMDMYKVRDEGVDVMVAQSNISNKSLYRHIALTVPHEYEHQNSLE